MNRNSPFLFPIGCKVLPRGLIFHSALAIYDLGTFVVCADSLAYFHVNRTLLEPLLYSIYFSKNNGSKNAV